MSPKPSRQASKRATPTRRDSREISPAPNVIPSSPLTLIVPSPLVGASRNPSLSSYPWRNNRFHCLQVKTPVAVAARVYVPSPTKQWSAGFRNIFTVISLFFVFFLRSLQQAAVVVLLYVATLLGPSQHEFAWISGIHVRLTRTKIARAPVHIGQAAKPFSLSVDRIATVLYGVYPSSRCDSFLIVVLGAVCVRARMCADPLVRCNADWVFQLTQELASKGQRSRRRDASSIQV